MTLCLRMSRSLNRIGVSWLLMIPLGGNVALVVSLCLYWKRVGGIGIYRKLTSCISLSYVLYRWQQFLIDNFVGYDTILTNSLLSACGRGTSGILLAVLLFLFRVVERPALHTCTFEGGS